ncbi:hypothetical protein [Pectobacterium brasiliense]|uniref:hypothetical protein n=1 Tax=Pectobacterium brasiliense TaxID=180957 RepID=UPI00193E58C5|nr:hypothetical protein [Pectobacterium brasiliense]QRN32620.1 hypothetical protein IHJ54_11430 [Pectobacterium brasiliense]
MTEVTVRTKAELKKAKNEKVEIINVEGDLAKNLKKGKKLAIGLAGVSGVALAAIGASIVAAPITGGTSLTAMSFVSAPAIAAISGYEIAAIIAASAIGLTLIVSIFKDYEEIDASVSNGIKLRRKRKK